MIVLVISLEIMLILCPVRELDMITLLRQLALLLGPKQGLTKSMDGIEALMDL